MAEATKSNDEGRDGGGGFRFWKKKKQQKRLPDDASRTGCGGFFRRVRGRGGKAPSDKPPNQQQLEPASGNGHQPAVQISFDDVELPEVMIQQQQQQQEPKGVIGGGDADDSEGSSVKSVCEEIVVVKAKQAESAWVRPPVAPPAAPNSKEKPKLALAKMTSKDSGGSEPTPAADQKPPRRPSAEKDKPATSSPEPEDEANAERQRIAEARFQRKSVDMRHVKAKGGVKIEQSPQSEMWWNIVNKSLVGTGLFVRAVACSLQSGGIFACNPADFAPTVEQVAALRDNFQNPSAFAAAGFAIGGDLYKIEAEGCTKELLSAVNLQHTEGLLVVKSNTAMLIGGFTSSRGQAQETLCDMRDLFVSQGL